MVILTQLMQPEKERKETMKEKEWNWWEVHNSKNTKKTLLLFPTFMKTSLLFMFLLKELRAVLFRFQKKFQMKNYNDQRKCKNKLLKEQYLNKNNRKFKKTNLHNLNLKCLNQFLNYHHLQENQIKIKK